jgi:hypothetical protein
MAHWGKSFLARVAMWSIAHGGVAIGLFAAEGWFLGMLAGAAVTDAFLRNSTHSQFVLPVLYTMTTVVYGAFLGATASVLGKR